jgi:hypothetical protein
MPLVVILVSLLQDIYLGHSQFERVLALKDNYEAILRERDGLCLFLLLLGEEAESPLQLPLKGEDRDPLVGDVEADDFLRSWLILHLHYSGFFQAKDLGKVLCPKELVAKALS